MSNATQNCEFCQSPAHIWFNCPKKPAGWKPDRLKKSASAVKPAPLPRMTDRSGESRKDRAGQAKKSTAAPVSELRLGKSTPEKGASRTVPQASHADIRVEGASGGSDPSRPTGGSHQQPALRTDVALGVVDTLKQAETAAAHLAPKSKGGRPKVHEDRKAYRAKKAKEYRERDRLKATRAE